MSTIIFKVALSKTTFNLSLLSVFLSRQPFRTFYTRKYNWDNVKNADYLHTEYSNYTYSHVARTLSTLLKSSDFFCEAAGHNTYFWITKMNNTILFSIALPEEEFIQQQTDIENFLNSLFKNENVIAAYISSVNDTWWLTSPHEQPSLFTYRRLQHSRYNCHFHKKEIVYNNFLSDEIWQPLCWKFWINIFELQQYINLLHFPHMISFSEIARHSYQFQLYHTHQDFSNVTQKQILKLLTSECSVKSEPDSLCEISASVESGELTLKLIQFLDQNNFPTAKEHAAYQEITTYLMLNSSTGRFLSKKKYRIVK